MAKFKNKLEKKQDFSDGTFNQIGNIAGRFQTERKRGRPALNIETTKLNFRIEIIVWNKFKKACSFRGVTPSDMIRDFIEQKITSADFLEKLDATEKGLGLKYNKNKKYVAPTKGNSIFEHNVLMASVRIDCKKLDKFQKWCTFNDSSLSYALRVDVMDLINSCENNLK